MDEATQWDYEGYWYAVLGQRTAEEVVAEFDLQEDGLDEWLGVAEAEAWRVGGLAGSLPATWAGHHRRAQEELVAAMAARAQS